MKALLAIAIAALAIAPVALGNYTERQTGAGKQFGLSADQLFGFYGAKPVAQTSGSAQLALSDSTGGVIPAVVVISGTAGSVTTTGTVTSGTSGASLTLTGVLPGDVLLSALVSGSVSALGDLEAVVTGTNVILQTGTSVLSGTNTAVVKVNRLLTPLKVVAVATLTSGTAGKALVLDGVLPGDKVISAIVGSGTSARSAKVDLEPVITVANQIVQDGTAVLNGNRVTVTVGRIPASVSYLPLVSGSNATNINANFAVMSQMLNEMRAALVKLGLIKGNP